MVHAVQISAPGQFSSLLSNSRVVVANFYETGNSSFASFSGIYEQLAGQLTRPSVITFTTVNVEQQPQIAQSYSVNTTPTFIVFRAGREVSRIRGATKLQELSDAIQKLALEAEQDGDKPRETGSGSGTGSWHGASLPRGYADITSQVDARGIELLNSDSDFGDVRTLFETTIPSTLAAGKGKGAASGSEAKKDWVESDVDEQLMLFIPFNATCKVHTIQLTSLPPKSEDDEDAPMRPRTVRLYANQTHNLGFEEADDVPATQTIELKPTDWDEKTGTAKLELRFVKFQNITSVVLFVVDGDGEGEKVRLDRVRIIGDAGEKRDMGVLEKVGDDA